MQMNQRKPILQLAKTIIMLQESVGVVDLKHPSMAEHFEIIKNANVATLPVITESAKNEIIKTLIVKGNEMIKEFQGEFKGHIQGNITGKLLESFVIKTMDDLIAQERKMTMHNALAAKK